MSRKGSFEALDTVLKGQTQHELIGSATVLPAGNFRQTLPVIPKGTRADEVNASIMPSCPWISVKKAETHNQHESAAQW